MSKSFDFDLIQKNQREFEFHGLSDRLIYAAVSGGVDSVVLLDHLVTLKKKFPKMKLECIHIHHGLGAHAKMNAYRNRAKKFVEDMCEHYKVPFHSNKVEKYKMRQSEETLRNYRNSFFDKLIESGGVVATAHHQDDVAETILIRMIRGAGIQGMDILPFYNDQKVRPLLMLNKKNIFEYCHTKKIKFIEDPSNKSLLYLRNWIRNKWLKDLEKYRPGSESVFKKSLLIQREWAQKQKNHDKVLSSVLKGGQIHRRPFLFLNKAEQRMVLAAYIKDLGIKNYRTTHLDEILKRLDSPKKVITFELLKCTWTIDTEYMWARPL